MNQIGQVAHLPPCPDADEWHRPCEKRLGEAQCENTDEWGAYGRNEKERYAKRKVGRMNCEHANPCTDLLRWIEASRFRTSSNVSDGTVTSYRRKAGRQKRWRGLAVHCREVIDEDGRRVSGTVELPPLIVILWRNLKLAIGWNRNYIS